MKGTLILLGVGLLTLALSSAYAGDTSTTTSAATSATANTSGVLDMKDVVVAAETAGYKNITEIEKKGDHYKLEAENANGKKVELKMDMTGKIYKVENEW